VNLAPHDIDNGADDADPRDPGGHAAEPAARQDRALPGPAMTTTTVEKPAELAVSACVSAFNAHDLVGILAHLHHDVDFRPLRLSGIAGAYHGHDGVRRWLEDLERSHYAHRIDLSAVRVAADGRVLAAGSLCLAGGANAPFTSVHRFENGLIIEAHQYFSDQALLQRLGLFP
jgi:ketosteroid isomerase-like protein